jgi:hypothetical protein
MEEPLAIMVEMDESTGRHAPQIAFLLLQLLGAEDRKLCRGEANRGLGGSPNKKNLGLAVRKANDLRRERSPNFIRIPREKTEKGEGPISSA